jgi:transposase-like protein
VRTDRSLHLWITSRRLDVNEGTLRTWMRNAGVCLLRTGTRSRSITSPVVQDQAIELAKKLGVNGAAKAFEVSVGTLKNWIKRAPEKRRNSAPRRFVWKPTFTIAGRSRARWACGQAALWGCPHVHGAATRWQRSRAVNVGIEVLFTSALGSAGRRRCGDVRRASAYAPAATRSSYASGVSHGARSHMRSSRSSPPT